MRPLDPRLLSRARPVCLLLALDVAIGLVAAVLVISQATLLARVIAGSFAGSSVAELTRPLVLLLLVFAARAGLAWAFEAVGRLAATGVLSQLRLALSERRLVDHPTALDGAQSAELAAASVFGATPLEAYFGRFLPQLVLAVLVPVAVVAWIIPIDAVSAAIMIVTLPLVPVFMILVGGHTARRTEERADALGQLAVHFLDVVRGLPTLRAFNRGGAQSLAIAERGERYRRATIATLRISFLSGAVLDLAATLGVALVAVSVGLRLDAGRIGLESALTVLILAPELYLPLRNVGAMYHASADGAAVAGRLLPLAEPIPPGPRRGDRRPPSPRGAVVKLERVSYAYPLRPLPVLSDVSLELDPGEVVALVGPTGSGKSTVASLLLGFAAPTAGRVMVGGVDIAGCEVALWRRSVAWVPQRPTVFRGTVAENIRLGRPSAPARAVREAAELAGADAFIRGLSDGYETAVGEGGRPLSAGQRQRIALARAFIRRAPLVVLDEPTANVDAATAGTIGEAIAGLGGEHTVLLIAHAPDVARRADRVVWLTAGRVADARRAVGAP